MQKEIFGLNSEIVLKLVVVMRIHSLLCLRPTIKHTTSLKVYFPIRNSCLSFCILPTCMTLMFFMSQKRFKSELKYVKIEFITISSQNFLKHARSGGVQKLESRIIDVDIHNKLTSKSQVEVVNLIRPTIFRKRLSCNNQ